MTIRWDIVTDVWSFFATGVLAIAPIIVVPGVVLALMILLCKGRR